MIQANKATTIASFHQQSLEVRKMELDYCLMVFDKLSSIASLLAGFASSALMIGIPQRSNPYLVTLFLLCTGSALGSNLLVVIVCTMCIMWGPGHALRGEDATYVDNAVFILSATQGSMEKFFMFGLVCYFISSVLVVWLLFDLFGSVVVSVIFVTLTLWLIIKSRKIHNALAPKTAVSGQVKVNRVKNIGELMGDDTLAGNSGVSTKFAGNI